MNAENTLPRVWRQLHKRHKKQLGFLLSLMLLASFLEAASIGAVVPFLAVLVDPQKLFSSNFSGPIIEFLDISSTNDLIFYFTGAFLSVVIVSGLVRLLLIWVQISVGKSIGADLSRRAFEGLLHRPYAYHLNSNSSAVISGMSKVDSISSAYISPLVTSVSSVLMMIFAFSALIAIEPYVAISGFVGFFLIYYLVAHVNKRRLFDNGKVISKLSNQRIKILQEGLGGIREVLLGGLQKEYSKAYQHADVTLRASQASTAFIGSSPKFIVEMLGTILIILIAYISMNQGNNFLGIVPVLGAFAFATQRILPVFQQLYAAITSLRGGRALIIDGLELLEHHPELVKKGKSKQKNIFQNVIKLDKVSFRYAKNAPWVLHDISLVIPKGSRIGIIGSTGSGKSTLLDILMGLLHPNIGRVSIDGMLLDESNVESWQKQFAHVPQSIFLADMSVAENIAFGESLERIDFSRVETAAEGAKIAEEIRSWSEGFNTIVGERGVRLSGGQRQRLGIARALYRDINVLFFDEATSALDNITEKNVIDFVNSIGSSATVIMIAHRLTTLKTCDVIIELKEGRIDRMGSYDEIVLPLSK